MTRRPPRTTIRPLRRLRAIKIIHTVAWAVFASAILAIPVFVLLDRRTVTWWLIGLVTLECLILACNRMRCPLTNVAARYTTDRQDNFDIYLPLWLARYNKAIFGSLFVAALAFTVFRWRQP